MSAQRVGVMIWQIKLGANVWKMVLMNKVWTLPGERMVEQIFCLKKIALVFGANIIKRMKKTTENSSLCVY